MCPLQPFSTEEGAKFVERVLMANDLDEIINFQSQTNSSNFFTKLMAARYVACNNVLDSSYSNTQRQDLGQSNEEMLLRCTWNGKECSPDRLSWSYDIYHGNCISFNDAPNSTTKEFLKTAKTGKIGKTSCFFGFAIYMVRSISTKGAWRWSFCFIATTA